MEVACPSRARAPQWVPNGNLSSCVLCNEETEQGKMAVIGHLAKHLQNISLSALPVEVGSEEASDTNSRLGGDSSDVTPCSTYHDELAQISLQAEQAVIDHVHLDPTADWIETQQPDAARSNTASRWRYCNSLVRSPVAENRLFSSHRRPIQNPLSRLLPYVPCPEEWCGQSSHRTVPKLGTQRGTTSRLDRTDEASEAR